MKEKYSQNTLLLVETTPTVFEIRIVNEKAEFVEMFSTVKFPPDVETNDCTVMLSACIANIDSNSSSLLMTMV